MPVINPTDNFRRRACAQMLLAPREHWLRDFQPARALSDDEIKALASRPAYSAQGGVAVIPIRGVMVKSAFWLDEVSTPAIAAAVRAATADQGVKTIVLLIDSPGGEVGGIADLADAVYAARSVKTVIAQIEGQANSAAYWVASQASKVFLGRNDVAGSIGVYTWLISDAKSAEDMGIKVHPITTGEFKGAGAIPGQDMTEAQIADAQRVVDTFFESFKADVARGRGMSKAQVAAVATGQVWIGAEVVRLGLADKVTKAEAPAPGSAKASAESRLAAARLALAEAELQLTGPAAESPAPGGKAAG